MVFGLSIGSNFESMARCWLCNKRYGVTNMFAAAVWLGLVEAKELLVFPGRNLDEDEITMACCPTDAEMLENPGPSEYDCWLRQCLQLDGDPGEASRADWAQPSFGGCRA
jgi:hypothetical protein